MKKHITIIALALFSLATVFSGCKKDNNNDQPEQKQKYNVSYELDNVCEVVNPFNEDTIVFSMSPCFKANISYVEASGNTTKLTDVTLPWKKEIIVEAPFNASVQVELTFKEEELPDSVTVVKSGRLGIKKTEASSYYYNEDKRGNTFLKNKFLEHIVSQPIFLKYGFQQSIN